jgi:hypothetical protein
MKTVVSLAVLALSAGMASATIMLPSSAATATPIDVGQYQGRAGTNVYTGQAGPYSAFAVATGVASFDDYVSTQAAPFNLAQFVFVGGVAQAGGGMTVAFFDTAANPVSNFHITLPQAGDFIWTITLGTPPDGLDSTFVAPQAGFVQITVDAANTGRWFFTSTAPTVGTNDVTVGSGSQLTPQRNNAFSLVEVPAPGSLALLGLGGLVARRRRR